MKVKDFIKWLEKQDQHAEVQVLTSSLYGYNSITSFEKFDIDKHSDYIDLKGNQFVKKDSENYNKSFLELGSDG